jgi:transposase
MSDKQHYSPEVRERALRMVREQRDHYNSEWAAIRSIAEKFGCKAETLCMWIRRDERDSGQRPGPTSVDSEELKRLKRECPIHPSEVKGADRRLHLLRTRYAGPLMLVKTWRKALQYW